jgi:hypothetical protein
MACHDDEVEIICRRCHLETPSTIEAMARKGKLMEWIEAAKKFDEADKPLDVTVRSPSLTCQSCSESCADSDLVEGSNGKLCKACFVIQHAAFNVTNDPVWAKAFEVIRAYRDEIKKLRHAAAVDTLLEERRRLQSNIKSGQSFSDVCRGCGGVYAAYWRSLRRGSLLWLLEGLALAGGKTGVRFSYKEAQKAPGASSRDYNFLWRLWKFISKPEIGPENRLLGNDEVAARHEGDDEGSATRNEYWVLEQLFSNFVFNGERVPAKYLEFRSSVIGVSEDTVSFADITNDPTTFTVEQLLEDSHKKIGEINETGKANQVLEKERKKLERLEREAAEKERKAAARKAEKERKAAESKAEKPKKKRKAAEKKSPAT